MSLRLRLVVAIGLVALIALVAADIATYSALRSFLDNRVDQSLRAIQAGPAQGFQPGQGGAPGGFQPPPNVTHQSAFFVERRTPAGRLEFSTGAYLPDGRRYTPQLPPSVTGPTSTGSGPFYLTTPSVQAGGPEFRVLVTTSPVDGDRVVIGQPLDATAGTLQHLIWIELAVTAGALVAAVLLGTWLVRVGLRPLERVEDTAEAIAAGDLGRRVPGEAHRTEVGRLARVLNVMLDRIQRAFAERDATEAQLRRSEEGLRRFVADASHELRTPLAAVTAYAELYDRVAAEHPEDQARIMKGIQGESARMKVLVEDLLLLARLDEGQPLERQPVELVSLSAEAVHAASAVGPAWPVTIGAVEPVEVRGDAQRLRQVLDNLLANVRAHTPAGTTATVTIRRDDSTAQLEVADGGPGISPEQAEQIFERFFRADPSRARSSGGSGLGLSIVAAIVEAHRGTVEAAPRPGGGSVFTVRLPLPEPQAGGDVAGVLAADVGTSP